ncbi:ladinin-1 isoform X3 [Colius striatus]|uniref:ladinin-1 isoform X3 n=1 Tax=Colius striatus TaxID=57412 RepID=UPI002B1DAED6|nr:ladinin-1 isoform X3 [Colius striatus]
MSFSRRNWSDLSSLARQRTLEDEEEQQRERRRRHRNLLSSTSTDEEAPSPVKDTSPAPSRPQSLVKSPEDGEEHQLTEVLKTQEGRRTRSSGVVSAKLRQDKEKQEPAVGESCTETGAPQRAGKESVWAGKRGQDATKGRGDAPGDQHPEPASERKVLQPSRNPSKEVIQLSPTQEEPAEKSDTSPTHITYSSSIRRISPRTVSFRMMSRNQKEESQSPLTRSASLRIPASSTTIGEKLEKYNSAVQRSEGAKSSLAVQKSLLLSSEGVASKRNFFEASTPSKAEPLAVRKDNLKIPGSVTSRINLWISRAQEPVKEEKSKDMRKINSLPKRDVWVKQPRDTPGDTKL